MGMDLSTLVKLIAGVVIGAIPTLTFFLISLNRDNLARQRCKDECERKLVKDIYEMEVKHCIRVTDVLPSQASISGAMLTVMGTVMQRKADEQQKERIQAIIHEDLKPL